MGVEIKTTNDGLYCRPSGVWAKEKLDYLRRYIEIFEVSMKNKWKTRNYIDIFSGPGMNIIEDRNEFILGSPLIALNTKPPFSHYYLIESDYKCYIALNSRIKPFLQVTSLYRDDANIVIDSILSEIRKDEDESLNLSFIDPEGLEIEWGIIEKLAKIKRMDLIINYPQQGLSRTMHNSLQLTGESKVDLFFGDIGWREIYKQWDSRSNQSGVHAELMTYYLDKLSRLGYKSIKRSDEIFDGPLIRNEKRKAPLYRLIFASKHDLGMEFWRKITQRNIYGQKRLFS